MRLWGGASPPQQHSEYAGRRRLWESPRGRCSRQYPEPPDAAPGFGEGEWRTSASTAGETRQAHR
ncbi:hypothetical protein [Pyrobaculum ferrireducens]|uniref:hypothetical protein n=1 Tax=Pyrobaculum ferrireducens TaxID=1104324 RepID=UPI000AA24B1F|nr:hypothetical protein [Pyrobaculum ferrireducens]